MLRLLRAAAAAWALLCAPAGAQNIGVRDARPGSLRGPQSHANFARLLGFVPGGGECGEDPLPPCCTPEGTADPFCDCGPICLTGNHEKCLCGTCVDDCAAACAEQVDPNTCEENCLEQDKCLYDGSTVPIYLSLKPSQAWIAAYNEGPALVTFKRGGKFTCTQEETLQPTEFGHDILEIVKRLPPPVPERARARRMKGKPATMGKPVPEPVISDGCAVGKVAQDRLQPENLVRIPGYPKNTSDACEENPNTCPSNEDYLIRIHTSCSKNILYLGANYTQTTKDEDYLSPRDGPPLNPLVDVFLTLAGFCVANDNNATNLTCSGEVPQIPDDQCPPGGGEGSVPPTDPPSTPPTTSPTKNPTESPTLSPTKNPTESPTKNPTESPTKNPTE
ncbi:hypothetical protein ACHAXT_009193, partial [Thalassiosira profunda]